MNSDPFSRPCRVALLGFGTVGSAVARRLVHIDSPFRLTQILDRRAEQQRPHADLSGVAWTAQIADILEGDADIVVETIGGVEPAADWTRAALAAGKSVVTANKQLIARHGPALASFAARQGRQLRFEAAIGGAMPIVRAIGDGLAGDRVIAIDAILNGTTNAVLSEIDATRGDIDDAIGRARALGYAEADPTADLDGDDARAKLAILCGLAFGLRVDPARIPTRSSASASAADFDRARSRGATIRQVAHADYDRARATLAAWVGPIEVARDSLFGAAVGPQNAAIITCAHAGPIGIFGAGAGGAATAVAILSDVAAIARDRAAVVPAPVLHSRFHITCSNFPLAEAV